MLPPQYLHDEAQGLWPAAPDGARLYDEESSLLDTWKGMEGVVAKGLARSIGVSNYSSAQLRHVAREGSVRPAVNQVESHPFLVQPELLSVCQQLGVAFSAYRCVTRHQPTT